MITHLRKLPPSAPPSSCRCVCCCARSPQRMRLSSPGDQEVKRLGDALTRREGIDGRARLSSPLTVFRLCSAAACVPCRNCKKSTRGFQASSFSSYSPRCQTDASLFSSALPPPPRRILLFPCFLSNHPAPPRLAALEVLLKTTKGKG